MGRLRRLDVEKVDFIRPASFDMHEACKKASVKFKQTEENWKELVRQGKAKQVMEKIPKGYRIHYELI